MPKRLSTPGLKWVAALSAVARPQLRRKAIAVGVKLVIGPLQAMAHHKLKHLKELRAGCLFYKP